MKMALLRAGESGDVATVQRLIRARSDVDARDWSGRTGTLPSSAALMSPCLRKERERVCICVCMYVCMRSVSFSRSREI